MAAERFDVICNISKYIKILKQRKRGGGKVTVLHSGFGLRNMLYTWWLGSMWSKQLQIMSLSLAEQWTPRSSLITHSYSLATDVSYLGQIFTKFHRSLPSTVANMWAKRPSAAEKPGVTRVLPGTTRETLDPRLIFIGTWLLRRASTWP